MKYTIFNTPGIKSFFRLLSLFLMKILGWKRIGRLPVEKRYVMIAAPHTSNWDLFYGMIMNLSFKNDVRWMGKKELFRFPFGGIMKWLGGIPVDRSRSGNLVAGMVDEFKRRESLVIAVSPEGSRSRVNTWKTGFYHIARGAGVPVLTAFLDYEKKEAGYGPLFTPGDDIRSDMELIMDFYRNIEGRYRSSYSSVVLKDIPAPD